MTPKTKKYMIAGIIGAVTITGALAYLQYKKIMNYAIKFKRLKVNKITANLIDINVFLTLENKSAVTYTIKSQEYSVYINDMFVSKISNNQPNEIKANSVSEVGVNVNFNPSDVMKKLGGGALLGSLLAPEKTIFKIVIKLKVSLFGLTVSIPITHITNLKELTSSKKEV